MARHITGTVAATTCVLLGLALGGCATNTENGALIGTAAGAGTGAAIGSFYGAAGVGALIGAPVGAVTGAVIGNEVDKQQYYDKYSHGTPRGEGRPGYYQTQPYPEYRQGGYYQPEGVPQQAAPAAAPAPVPSPAPAPVQP